MSMVDWSDLQPDLVGEIAKKIGSVVDFLVFSRVCRSWRLAAIKENCVLGAQFPWLMLAADKGDDDNNKLRGFFDLSNNKRYDLHVPQLCGCRLWGSSIGWIVSLNIRLEVHLVNPITRLELSLPHLYTLEHLYPPGVDITPPEADEHWHMCCFIVKALVFKRKNQLMVATIYAERDFLAIARPGDECWTEVELGVPYDRIWVKDVAYFKEQLFVLHEHGTLVLCEFIEEQGRLFPKLVTIADAPVEIQNDHYKMYLVASMDDLLMVVRWLSYRPGETIGFPYKTVRFDIYKLDFKKKMWTVLKNLGGMTLFLGDSYSMSLCSSDIAGCQRNAIYYTDDNSEQWDSSDRGGHDVGVFSLDERAFHPLPNNNSLVVDDLRSTFSCPIWMMPSLF